MRDPRIVPGVIAVAITAAIALGAGSWILAFRGPLPSVSAPAPPMKGRPTIETTSQPDPGSPSPTPWFTRTPIPPSPTPVDTPSPTPIPTSTALPTPPLAPVGESALLEPMVHEYQKLNNCGPIATEMVLSYYGIVKNQFEVAASIRPHPADRAAFPEDILRYVGQFGLSGKVRVNGSEDLLKSLVSNGIPVITETLLKKDDDIGHYRVVRGYNEQQGVFILGDPYYGATVSMPYAEFDQLWRAYNRRYIPIYQPDSEATVKRILGDDYDERADFEGALRVAQEVASANPGDVQARLNVGESYFGLGDYQAAANSWEQAESLGVPFRTLWYITWPVTAYNELGEYDRAIALTQEALAQNQVAPELIYEQGVAHLGLGNREKAAELFRLALDYDPNLDQVRQALEQLQ